MVQKASLERGVYGKLPHLIYQALEVAVQAFL